MLRLIAIPPIALADASGANPRQPSLHDYVHTAWTQRDGAPLFIVRDIKQSPERYLPLVSGEEGPLRLKPCKTKAVTVISDCVACGSAPDVIPGS